MLLPILGIAVFAVSYIAVFGFRASLISFVGLLAITLSFTRDYTEESLLIHAVLIAIGGFWYLLLMYLKTRLFPRIQTEQLFIKTIDKTAEYLKVRGELLVDSANRNELYKKLFEMDGISESLAKECLRLAATKLPIRARFVQRHGHD